MKWIFFIALTFVITSCLGQEKLDATLIFESKVKNDVIVSIKRKDSLYFSNKYDWLAFKNLSLWCLPVNGIKYSYNYDEKVLSEVNGIFPDDRKIRNPSDFFGKVEYNFYFDKNIVGWFTSSKDRNIEVIRSVDIEKGTQQETTFYVPKNLQDIQPIIISPNQLLYHNYILNSNNTIDTLKVGEGVSFPHFDRVYMRKNSFMVDKYHELQNPLLDDANAIDYIRIEGNLMVAQKVNPPNVKIANYRVEANHENIWLMSHKITPEKFLIYNVDTQKAHPFELAKSIFKLENLRVIELEPDIEAPYDVKFSYHTSMTESDLYIYMIKNGIKLYRVSDYQQLLR